MIIGLHGIQRSGKDTVFSLIQSEYPHAIRLAFADKIKESLAALFGVSVREIDILKKERAMFKVESKNYEHSYTWRSFAQRYGTEAHREIFGEDFWVDKVLPRPNKRGINSHKNKLWIITDVRFSNEALRIKELGGKVVSLKRPDLQNIDNHVSENSLNNFFIDYELVNDGSLEQLKERAIKIVEDIMG